MEARSRTAVICLKIRGNGNQEKKKKQERSIEIISHTVCCFHQQSNRRQCGCSQAPTYRSNSWFVHYTGQSGEPQRLFLSFKLFGYSLVRDALYHFIDKWITVGSWLMKKKTKHEFNEFTKSGVSSCRCSRKISKCKHVGSVERVSISTPES